MDTQLTQRRRGYGMDNSRLPIDICEHIIDACYEPNTWLHETSYPSWRQTAIVCFDWYPRTRYNILYEVDIHRASQLDHLLRTLLETPHLGDLINAVWIQPGSRQYIPFARLLHPRFLSNCSHLSLYRLDWKAFPPRYADTSLYSLRGSRLITHLTITIDSGCCAAILHFIYSLPLLQELALRSTTAHIPWNVLTILSTRPCPFNKLTTLRLFREHEASAGHVRMLRDLTGTRP
ncbi:hypothetical protein C8Q74DRAFT_588171 [Fomes fomentarius]|nr:hypothetical protein C8Q74DRAFT_588171 [Fomes fomentarius]